MDAGRWTRYRDAQPLTETSHHGRVQRTLSRRLLLYALFVAAAWLVVIVVGGATWAAVMVVIHLADAASRHATHMRP